MKKYYAIINAFKFNNKEWWITYSIEWILQSKFPVKWSKKVYFSESEFEENFWGNYDPDKSNLWLDGKYLEAIESLECVKEMRVWYWRKNYSIKWVEVSLNPQGSKQYVIYALLESDYSVSSLRRFIFTPDQFSVLFSDVDSEDKCYWLKDKILEVVESYKLIENLPENLE